MREIPAYGIHISYILSMRSKHMDRDKMERVRISANLPKSDFLLLKELAERLGISMTDVIRRGIRTEKWFEEQSAEENTILLKDKDGNVSKVLVKG